ncbi:MAG: uroporphyrinogen decarboxylase family protein [Armatimonadetes bacterium]|nr:uroporphyrinogen decarboxylase family protein [Armatimonadota bacterium]
MSYAIGIEAIRLQSPERLAHTEYCSNYALVRAVTGKDPTKAPDAWRDFYDAWQIDLLWVTNDGAVPWSERGRVTDMGHAEFLEGGIDRRDRVFCPFRDAEEVLRFDAVEEYGLPDMDELVAYYESFYRQGQAEHPNQIFTAGYYKTLISGAIEAFGWERLLEAAADRRRFDKVLESFYQLSLHHYRAWARTSAPVFICHDDMVWSEGAFLHPDFYRSAIFPRYAKLWQVLHEAGKVVLFCSDGTWTQFVDDIAQAGADGFIFEPTTSLEYVVERYGKTHVIVSSKVDARTLTFGMREQIQREIDDTLRLAAECPGFVFAVGNHIPSNVPVDNALYYFDYLSNRWWRR